MLYKFKIKAKMIKSIKFKKDFRNFKKDFEIQFKEGVNVLVGDQGSGKSTLIELIRLKFEDKRNDSDSSWRAKSIEVTDKVDDIVEFVFDKDTKALGFDFERESPRDMSSLHFDMIDVQMYSSKASHGQGNMAMFGKFIQSVVENSKYNVVLMDEPDTAMSPRNVYNITAIIDKLYTKFKKQVFVSAHNPILIKGTHFAISKEPFWTEVYSVENSDWIKPEVYMVHQCYLTSEDSKEITKNK